MAPSQTLQTEQRHDAGQQNVPIPDPSILTTKQLEREIAQLRELLEGKLTIGVTNNEATKKIIETRLEGMDKAIKLVQDGADKLPFRIDEKIQSLKDVQLEKLDALTNTHSEKFSSIQTQFRERDVRTEQSSKDSKVAVDAALQAAKEAVGEQNKSSALAIAKSEASTTKQIDQITVLIANMTKAFDDKIGDVKDRLTRIEGESSGGRNMWGYVFGGIMLLIAVATFLVKTRVP